MRGAWWCLPLLGSAAGCIEPGEAAPCEGVSQLVFSVPQARALVGETNRLRTIDTSFPDGCQHETHPVYSIQEVPEGVEPTLASVFEPPVPGTYRVRLSWFDAEAEAVRYAVTPGRDPSPPDDLWTRVRCNEAASIGPYLLCLNDDLRVVEPGRHHEVGRADGDFSRAREVVAHTDRFAVVRRGCRPAPECGGVYNWPCCSGDAPNQGAFVVGRVSEQGVPTLEAELERAQVTAVAMDNTRLYVTHGSDRVEAFSIEGELRSLGCGTYPPSPLVDGRPAIAGDRVLVGTESGLYAFERADLERGCDAPAQAVATATYDGWVGGPTAVVPLDRYVYVVDTEAVRAFALDPTLSPRGVLSTESSQAVGLNNTLYRLQWGRLWALHPDETDALAAPQLVRTTPLVGTTLMTDGQRILITAP